MAPTWGRGPRRSITSRWRACAFRWSQTRFWRPWWRLAPSPSDTRSFAASPSSGLGNATHPCGKGTVHSVPPHSQFVFLLCVLSFSPSLADFLAQRGHDKHAFPVIYINELQSKVQENVYSSFQDKFRSLNRSVAHAGNLLFYNWPSHVIP